jgi:hypothetical protein
VRKVIDVRPSDSGLRGLRLDQSGGGGDLEVDPLESGLVSEAQFKPEAAMRALTWVAGGRCP